VNIVNFFYLFIYYCVVCVNMECKKTNKRQPNYSQDEIEVIVAGVEKNNKVSIVQMFSLRLGAGGKKRKT